MEYLLRLIFLTAIIGKFIIKGNVTAVQISMLLIIIAANILKHKFKVTWIGLLIETGIITAACINSSNFSILYGIIAYDAGNKDTKALGITATILGAYFSGFNNVVEILMIIFISFIFGNLNLRFNEKTSSFKETYDNERRYRYELEAAKQRLLNSAKESAYIAEIRERNRIAREIHDTVGHSIAGILLQLQVVQKLRNKDQEKSDGLLKDSIERLAETLNVMRNTVHNIKPNNTMGLEYIKSIIDNFKFCAVNFKHSGNFNSMPANILETISSDIKEALTNAYKYSKATAIDIEVNVNDELVRVYIKDNGEGCPNLKEGFGLMGIRERIKNLGGTVSFSGENGFIIVYVIPIKDGGEFGESNNC